MTAAATRKRSNSTISSVDAPCLSASCVNAEVHIREMNEDALRKRQLLAKTCGNLGALYHLLDRPSESIAKYQRAVNIRIEGLRAGVQGERELEALNEELDSVKREQVVAESLLEQQSPRRQDCNSVFTNMVELYDICCEDEDCQDGDEAQQRCFTRPFLVKSPPSARPDLDDEQTHEWSDDCLESAATLYNMGLWHHQFGTRNEGDADEAYNRAAQLFKMALQLAPPPPEELPVHASDAVRGAEQEVPEDQFDDDTETSDDAKSETSNPAQDDGSLEDDRHGYKSTASMLCGDCVRSGSEASERPQERQTSPIPTGHEGDDLRDEVTVNILTLINIGQVYLRKSMFNEALRNLLIAWRMIRAKVARAAPTARFHSTSRQTQVAAAVLSALSNAHLRRGDVSDALNANRAVLHILQSITHDTPFEGIAVPAITIEHDAARALHNMGTAYGLSGPPQAALEAYGAALSVTSTVLRSAGAVAAGTEGDRVALHLHASSLYQTGLLLLEMDHPTRALQPLQGAIELKVRLHGTQEHPSVIRSFELLGTAYANAGQYEQAVQVFQRAATLLRAAFGPNNVRLASTLCDMGRLYHSTGHVHHALSTYDRAVSILRHCREHPHDDEQQERDVEQEEQVILFLRDLLQVMGTLRLENSDIFGAARAFREAAALDGSQRLSVEEITDISTALPWIDEDGDDSNPPAAPAA